MAENKAALAFGTNLGDKKQNISRALDCLQKGGFKITAVSSSMESEPVDCTPESGIFLNGALTGLWPGTADELLSLCQKVELTMGRKARRALNSPRPIDLDILLFNEEEIYSPALQVPHPRMHIRDFVMLPLCEVAADWLVPGKGKSVRDLAENFK